MKTQSTQTPQSAPAAHTLLFLPLNEVNGTNCFYARTSNGKYAFKSIGDDVNAREVLRASIEAVNSHASLLRERDALHEALSKCVSALELKLGKFNTKLLNEARAALAQTEGANKP